MSTTFNVQPSHPHHDNRKRKQQEKCFFSVLPATRTLRMLDVGCNSRCNLFTVYVLVGTQPLIRSTLFVTHLPIYLLTYVGIRQWTTYHRYWLTYHTTAGFSVYCTLLVSRSAYPYQKVWMDPDCNSRTQMHTPSSQTSPQILRHDRRKQKQIFTFQLPWLQVIYMGHVSAVFPPWLLLVFCTQNLHQTL